MLTAETFHANLTKIVTDAGGVQAVSGKSLAAVFDLFEMLFGQYMPMYPTGKFAPGVHFLTSQGAPKPAMDAVQAGWEMKSGKRQLDATGMRKAVAAAVQFAQWWQQNPKFLAMFARLAKNIAGDTAAPNSRIRHSGTHLKPVKLDLPDWLDEDKRKGKGAGKDAGKPAGGERESRGKGRPKKQSRAKSVGPKASMQDLLDAELEFGDPHADDPGSNTDLLIPSGRRAHRQTLASKAKKGDASALAEAAKAKLAEFEKAKAGRESKEKTQAKSKAEAAAKAKAEALAKMKAAAESKQRALEIAKQKAAEQAKKRAADINRSKAKARDAEQSAAKTSLSSRKTAVVPDDPAKRSTISGVGDLIERAKVKVIELAQACEEAVQKAKALEVAQGKAAARLKVLAAEGEKAKAIAAEVARDYELLKGKLAMVKAGKAKASPADKQKLEAKVKATLEAASKAKAAVLAKAKEFGEIKAKAQEIAKQRGVILTKAKALAAARDKAAAAAKMAESADKTSKAKSAKSGMSATVIESKVGAAIPGSARRPRPATQPPIRPGSRAISLPASAAPPPPPPKLSPAASKESPTAKPPAKPESAPKPEPADAKLALKSATQAPDAPKFPAAKPGPNAVAAADVANPEDKKKAEEQLAVISAALAEQPSPYEAFRLYLQRISVLRFLDPNHDDIPSREFIDQLKDEIAGAREGLGRIKHAPEWAALFHVWLLATYGARPYLILDSLTVLESPANFVAVGQKLSLLVVYPPFIYLCRRPRGAGFAGDPRISLLMLNPWATVPSIDPEQADAVRLKLAFLVPEEKGKLKEETVTLRYVDRSGRSQGEILQGLEEFLGDVLTIRSQFVDYVFDQLAKLPLSAGTFDYYLAHMRRCADVPTLPERVVSYKNLLEGMLRDVIFWLRPSELQSPSFVQLLDLGLKHALFDSADLRRRVMRIQTLFRPEDEQLPPGMLENAAMDCKMIVMTMLDDLAPDEKRDLAFDDTYAPRVSAPDAVEPFTALEGDPDDFLVKTVIGWFGGELPQP